MPPSLPFPRPNFGGTQREVKNMANCETCKNNEKIPQQSKNELAFAFTERMVKRLWIALCISIALAAVGPLAVHFGWLYYESQFETVEYSYDYQQDDEGANIIRNGNDVNNGATAESEG